MNRGKSAFLFWSSVILTIFIVHSLVPPKYSFYGDSLIKLLMAKSLLLRNFESINYFYFFENFDPNFTYFPIDYHLYHIQKENLHFGPFGFSFSFFSAILLKIFPYFFLPLLSSLALIFVLYYLRKFWNLHYSSLGFLVFCTSLLIYIVEFSENIFFIIFHFLSLSFFLQEKWGEFWDSFLASLLLVVSISFRLESLMYLGLLVPVYVYVYKFNINKKKLFLFLSFTILFLGVFFFLNYFIYGHILGSKYLADQKNFFSTLNQKLINYFSLWIGMKEEMFFKPGFFGLTPLFLAVFYIGFQNFKILSPNSQILLLTSFAYILIAPFFAPHDGHWSWGARYLSITILPLGIVLNELNLIPKVWSSARWKKNVLIALLVVSFVQVFLGIFIISISSQVMKQVQENTSKIDSHFRIFQNGIFALHTGPQILETNSLLVKNKEDLEKLIPLLRNFPNQKIAFLYSKKLENLLAKGNVFTELSEETAAQILEKNFEFLGQESQNELISIRKYLIPKQGSD